MHDTAELKRQFEAERLKCAESQRKAKAAQRRYHRALCDDLLDCFRQIGGVKGTTKVRDAIWLDCGAPDMDRGPFIVTGAKAAFGKARYTFARVNKDGTARRGSGSQQIGDRIFILPEDNE